MIRGLTGHCQPAPADFKPANRYDRHGRGSLCLTGPLHIRHSPHQTVIGSPVKRFIVVGLLLISLGCSDASQPEETNSTDRAEAPPVPSAPAMDFSAQLTADELRRQLGVGKNTEFRKAGGRFVEAFLAESAVEDLAPLKGQPLKLLDLSRTAVSDLSPLAGMPLERLSLFETKVDDLSPLEGMPLRFLDLTNTPVDDISPLEGMRLEELYLEGTNVRDISVVHGMPLQNLRMEHCPVEDISPLEGMGFDQLSLFDTQVKDISVVRTMPRLGTIWLRETPVSDISALADINLESLDIQETQVDDLSPLAGKTSLRRLNIAGTPITDLRPLEGLPLTRLIFTPRNITEGLDVVRGMTTLTQLDVQFDDYDRVMTPDAFWAKYDAGELTEEK
ncbi:Internalin-A precursor [Maioricimonas rarisocia]|uniref:Internalin-A n=1 Tax=Maioricimonas rarisocia TaxID=2528026 RepID=A0A517Z8Y3_9PLAN|nr:Internalin-A precursor [Maioricimonas rarisocia]